MTKYVRSTEIRRERNRAGLAVAMAAAALSALAFGYVWQRIYLGQQLADIDRMASRHRGLVEETKRLSLQLQREISWTQVERAAGERLGMSYPEKSQLATAILPPAVRTQGLWALARGLASPVSQAWSQP
jgi:cell division protein FtsL